MLRRGMNVFALRDMMGHADLSTTQKSLVLTLDDLRKAHVESSLVNEVAPRRQAGEGDHAVPPAARGGPGDAQAGDERLCSAGHNGPCRPFDDAEVPCPDAGRSEEGPCREQPRQRGRPSPPQGEESLRGLPSTFNIFQHLPAVFSLLPAKRLPCFSPEYQRRASRVWTPSPVAACPQGGEPGQPQSF